ncbi:MAG: FAD-dependent oxidoreductase [Burkholderiaceae bacterium]
MTSAPHELPTPGRTRQLVLVGAGHAHAEVLLTVIQKPIPDLDIVLVSPYTLAPYSGMVPAWLANAYSWEACCIDFDALCKRAGARLIAQNVVGIDPADRQISLDAGGRLAYDWLSINIGSTLHVPTDPGAVAGNEDVLAVPMRPLTALRERWQNVLDHVGRLPVDAQYRVLMVGGGAAGIESMLAVQYRLTTLAPHLRYHFVLATQGRTLVPGLSARAGSILREYLRRRDVTVQTGFSANRITDGAVLGSAGQSILTDLTFWATGAKAFDWPHASELATDPDGFIRVDAMLRSTSHPEVFATGDCASWEDPLPKAGVYAVRMGPVLAHNLRATIQHTPTQRYVPQPRYLMLVGTGDRHAVASWGPFGWQGAWVYAWKQQIDRRFLARYNGTDHRHEAAHPRIRIQQEKQP